MKTSHAHLIRLTVSQGGVPAPNDHSANLRVITLFETYSIKVAASGADHWFLVADSDVAPLLAEVPLSLAKITLQVFSLKAPEEQLTWRCSGQEIPDSTNPVLYQLKLRELS
jgi:hypothetical protein